MQIFCRLGSVLKKFLYLCIYNLFRTCTRMLPTEPDPTRPCETAGAQSILRAGASWSQPGQVLPVRHGQLQQHQDRAR